MKLAVPDKKDMVRELRRAHAEQVEELLNLCREQIDTDGDGRISYDELQMQMADHNSDLRIFVEYIGLDRADFESFFNILVADDDPLVDIETFVHGVVWMSQGGRETVEILRIVQTLKRLRVELDEQSSQLAWIRKNLDSSDHERKRY